MNGNKKKLGFDMERFNREDSSGLNDIDSVESGEEGEITPRDKKEPGFLKLQETPQF
jgi:hypothetical protein